LEQKAISHAIENVVPEHLEEVRSRKLKLIAKTEAAVKDRLTKEINYWDHRAEDLKAQEQAGKTSARMNSAKARARADTLDERLKRRHIELEQERQISPLPPVVLGGALIIPFGLLEMLRGYRKKEEADLFARKTSQIEKIAMQAVMEKEKSFGFAPRDVSAEKCGYDIESGIPGSGRLRFIEVKGRVEGAKTITVTKNEILTSLNKPEDYILAIVEVENNSDNKIHYIKRPFEREPDFGVTSINYDIEKLIAKARD